MQLAPVHYQYKAEQDISQRQRTGFIAQEVQAIFPTAVITEDVDINPESGQLSRQKNDYLGMNYLELIPVSIKAIQELKTELDSKDQRIKQLETEFAALKNLVHQHIASQNR